MLRRMLFLFVCVIWLWQVEPLVAQWQMESTCNTEEGDTTHTVNPDGQLGFVALWGIGPNPSTVNPPIPNPGPRYLPNWYQNIFDQSFSQVSNIPAYLSDASFTQLQTTAQGFAQNSTTPFQVATDPTTSETQFTNQLLAAADAVVDFSQFDLNGPAGVPDSVVDFVAICAVGYGGNNGRDRISITGGEYLTNDTDASGHRIRIRSSNGAYQAIWSPDNRREDGMEIMLHELGHHIAPAGRRGFPDLDHSGGVQFYHHGVGDFGIMLNYAGFLNADGSTRPSLYNPALRITGNGLAWGANWVTPIDINAAGPQQDRVIGIFNTTGEIFKLAPVNTPTGAAVNQYFLLTRHNSSVSGSYWEQRWPIPNFDAVMIWQVNPTGYLPDRQRKPIDVEAAQGMTDWNLSTYTDLGTPNNETGFDSLDTRVATYNEFNNQGSDAYFFHPDGNSNFTHSTNPSSALHAYSSPYSQFYTSGVAVTDIHRSGNDLRADLWVNSYVGEIKHNVTWSGEVYLLGDVILSNNARLTIDPGTTIEVIGPGVDLWVLGGSQVIAQGTVSQPITFTSALSNPIHSSWGTIFVLSDDNIFEYCTVAYSDWGIKIDGTPANPLSGNVVRHCTLRDSDQGLRIEDAIVTVENNTIRNNRHGVVVINAEVDFASNDIHTNDRDGIYAVNGTLDLFFNLIHHNGLGQTQTINGIFGSSNSDITVGGAFGDPTPGYNEIYNNQGSGLNLSTNATAFLGSKAGAGAYGGYNSISNNGLYSGKEIYNTTTYSVIAQKNWWGTANPTSSLFYGSVDYNFWLTFPPAKVIQSNPLAGSLSPEGAGLFQKTVAATTGSSPVLDSLKTVVLSSATVQEKSTALALYYSVVRRDRHNALGEQAAVLPFLETVQAREQHSTLAGQVFVLRLDALLRRGQYAEVSAQVAAPPVALDESAQPAAYVYAVFATVATQNFAEAEKWLQTYSRDFPKASELVLLREYVAGKQLTVGRTDSRQIAALVPAYAGMQPAAAVEGVARPSSSASGLAVSPNPFNPETSIRFRLQEARQVRLTIYDLSGRAVRQLVAGEQAAGEHVIRWDGRDEQGQTLASGVYFALLRLGEKVERIKLTLLR